VYAYSVGDIDNDGLSDFVVEGDEDSIQINTFTYPKGLFLSSTDFRRMIPVGCYRYFDSINLIDTCIGQTRAFVDFNADGYDDLLVSGSMRFGRQGVTVAMNEVLSLDQFEIPDATYQPPYPLGLVALGDFNGDGFSDVARCNNIFFGPFDVDTRLQTDELDGMLRKLSVRLSDTSGCLMPVGDVNGDGFSDIATSGTGSTIAVIFGHDRQGYK
jgi:hypothetical protein